MDRGDWKMATSSSHAAIEPLARRLQNLLDRTVAEDRAVPGGVMRVETPALSWRSASGMADPERGVAMLPDDQFQAASITKMITAATLMSLVEEGRVDLDAGIGRHLPASVTAGAA
jgi:D-alanyl-D-alanine carboxypeptidase